MSPWRREVISMTQGDEQATHTEMLTVIAFVALLVDVVTFFASLANWRGWPLPSVLSAVLLAVGLWLCNRRPEGTSIPDSFGFAELLLTGGSLAALLALVSCFSTQLPS
jgi:hypothetical protein